MFSLKVVGMCVTWRSMYMYNTILMYRSVCCVWCYNNRNVDSLGAKELVMGMVNHGNSDVRMQALLAIQKMMVQNW